MPDTRTMPFEDFRIPAIPHLPAETAPSWYKAITADTLVEIAERIVVACDPEKIILFGSHAYGRPDLHSDVDLLVITKRYRNKSVYQRDYLVARVARPPQVAMDLLVRTPQEVASRLKMGDPFFREIMITGKVLYERKQARR
ncbi:MAG: nucleotidyltransferase domain-containing protein [candidate division KSB1 bacterium]